MIARIVDEIPQPPPRKVILEMSVAEARELQGLVFWNAAIPDALVERGGSPRAFLSDHRRSA